MATWMEAFTISGPFGTGGNAGIEILSLGVSFQVGAVYC